MSIYGNRIREGPSGKRCPYRTLPLADLVARIVDCRDREALAEFHNRRPVFRLRDGQSGLLIQFITWLCETSWARRCAGWHDAALEQVRDAVADWFTLLADDDQACEDHRGAGRVHSCGYRSFLRAWAKWKQDNPGVHPLQEELEAARILQRVVVSHFRFSCLEARRQYNPARTRYAWLINGGVIYLWMPAWKYGHERRRWLEAHANHPDPSCPKERRRIQAIVDTYLGAIRQVPLAANTDALAVQHLANATLSSTVEHEVSARGLVTVIADEKADRIHEQRPAIQALGKTNLKKLVISILQAITEERYDESQVAHDFGLSKSAVSRFAGIRWKESGRIPDLWANFAHTLANHASFVETAQDAGVWQQVQEVLGRKPEGEIQRKNDV